MRAIFPVTAFASLLTASPTFANQITQTLPAVQTLGDFVPFDISGSGFTPSLGTLDSVTGKLTGVATPNFFDDLGPFPTTALRTRWFLHADFDSTGPNAFMGTLPDQIVTPIVSGPSGSEVGDYKGSPIALDLTFNFGNPAEFIGAPSQSLLEFGFITTLPDFVIPDGASDLTGFNGNMVLTYNYTPLFAPEPSSLSLLGLGALALIGYGLARRPLL